MTLKPGSHVKFINTTGQIKTLKFGQYYVVVSNYIKRDGVFLTLSGHEGLFHEAEFKHNERLCINEVGIRKKFLEEVRNKTKNESAAKNDKKFQFAQLGK